MKEEEEVKGATKGTAYHKVVELLDFSGNMETIGKHEHHKDETFKLSLYPSR